MKSLILFAVAASAALMSPAPARAWSYSGAGQLNPPAPGDTVTSVDARTLALGGTSIASSSGVGGLFYNPANLSFQQRRSLMLGMYSNFQSEASQAEKQYSSSVLYKGPVFGVMIPAGGFRFAAGYRNELDMGYLSRIKSYSAGQADTSSLEISGGAGRFIIASGFEAFGGLHAGLSMNLVSGNSDGSSVVTLYQTSRDTVESERKFSGSFIEAGAAYELNRDTILGITLSPGYTLKDKWSYNAETASWSDSAWASSGSTALEGSRDISMPARAGAGMQYKFLGLDRTIVTADIRKIFWSSYRYTETDSAAAGYNVEVNPGYRDTTRFSVGAEHYVNFTTALRAGFYYEPFYGDTSVDQAAFTAGAGFELGRDLFIDTGGSIGSRTYRGSSPFSDDIRTVSETHINLMATAEWYF